MGRRRINTLRSCRRTYRQRPKEGVKNVPENSRPILRTPSRVVKTDAPSSAQSDTEEPANDNWDFWDETE
ncbi:hypothetical protein SAMN03159496_02259 [Rhizobium sp. NFR07]|nr:hypothetical protein SAMN03159496_02259 [Rhizobium sp. NFR07]